VSAPRLEIPADATAWAEEKMGRRAVDRHQSGRDLRRRQAVVPRSLHRPREEAGEARQADRRRRAPRKRRSARQVAKGARRHLHRREDHRVAARAAIARCSLFVTNDTGPMHVADAVGTPMVAIFGPTDWIVHAAFGKNHTIVRHEIEVQPLPEAACCPLKHHDCMKKIDVGPGPQGSARSG
jgi:hypothetical protein